ncbi:MAG: hypothetical protein ACK40O_13540, partial [Allosphingosinicella sp.]
GAWTADFRFPRDAAVWAFARSDLARVSNQPWRPESWTVETPGVRLERQGWYDVLVAADGGPVPRNVRIRFTPFAEDIETGYDAALVFTDGSVALFDQQFKAFPAASPAEVAALPLDAGQVPAAAQATRVTFRDAGGRVLHAGRRHASVTLDDAGTYVLFGPAEPIVTDAIAAIVDPGLPGWLGDFLDVQTPLILGRYAAALGPPPGPKPTLMASWGGPVGGPGHVSTGGSVLPGLVVMTFMGEGLLEEQPPVRDQTRWFIAHEGAHFWLGQAVMYESPRDAWITEGGADLLAIRTVAAIDPAYDARAALQRLLDECLKLSAGGPLSSAQERGAHRAFYGCGAMFGLAAEASSGKSFPAWIRPLIDANRADGVLSRAEWLAALGDPALRQAVLALLDTGAADPARAYAALFARAGVPHVLAADGTLTLQ